MAHHRTARSAAAPDGALIVRASFDARLLRTILKEHRKERMRHIVVLAPTAGAAYPKRAKDDRIVAA